MWHHFGYYYYRLPSSTFPSSYLILSSPLPHKFRASLTSHHFHLPCTISILNFQLPLFSLCLSSCLSLSTKGYRVSFKSRRSHSTHTTHPLLRSPPTTHYTHQPHYSLHHPQLHLPPLCLHRRLRASRSATIFVCLTSRSCPLTPPQWCQTSRC